MSETDEFSHVQRRLCAVIAKSEWTSSRMRMQKSGDELRERRAKSHRTANQFLQGLLENRTDHDLIDDNGTLDRYQRFLKYKLSLNDDSNDTLSEFDRRLRALNQQRLDTTFKLNKTNGDSVADGLNQQETIEYPKELLATDGSKNELVQEVPIADRSKSSHILPSATNMPVTSTPNDTVDDILDPVFHADEEQETSLQELSSISSKRFSPKNTLSSAMKSSIDHSSAVSLEKVDVIPSFLQLAESSKAQTLFRPKARRPDGTELISVSTLPKRSSSNSSPWNHCSFPRSLMSRGKSSALTTSKRQLPSIPPAQPPSHRETPDEQFDKNQLYKLLDHLDKNSQQSSTVEFTMILDQMTASTVLEHTASTTSSESLTENLSVIQDEDLDRLENTISPTFFNQPLPSADAKRFYSTMTISLNDSNGLQLYTMTCSTVQLSASMSLPYSILNGRRPFLKLSKQTHFKPVRSKRENFSCQLVAIESMLNSSELKQNDIILKINDQSVWSLTIEEIIEQLKECKRLSSGFSLTVARLRQPFV